MEQLLFGYLLGAATVFIGAAGYFRNKKSKARKNVIKNIRSNSNLVNKGFEQLILKKAAQRMSGKKKINRKGGVPLVQ